MSTRPDARRRRHPGYRPGIVQRPCHAYHAAAMPVLGRAPAAHSRGGIGPFSLKGGAISLVVRDHSIWWKSKRSSNTCRSTSSFSPSNRPSFSVGIRVFASCRRLARRQWRRSNLALPRQGQAAQPPHDARQIELYSAAQCDMQRGAHLDAVETEVGQGAQLVLRLPVGKPPLDISSGRNERTCYTEHGIVRNSHNVESNALQYRLNRA